MAFSSQKAGGLIALGLISTAAFAAEIRFPVRHDHWRKGCQGTMAVDEHGISFRGAKKHSWRWKYEDIQELKLEPGHLEVLTYRDSKLRLGADRAYQFTGKIPEDLYPFWKDRLDQRFVAALPDRAVKPEWSIPAKHLGRISGTQGVLEFGADRIVYRTGRKEDSRTWRFADIDNISSSGPFQLTITTFERARMHYGDRKGFNFQLKEALTPARYDQLWRNINQKNGRIP